ncbi:MAG: ParB N-terminal domain-containing protein [Myxococcota bacterium]|nr:ParB N-terminal domain-containing protein [Myxococcota bacterium]
MISLELGQLVLRYKALRVMDPGRVSRLAASLSREGQRSPVLVVAGGVLVDGYHRVAALEDLGRDVVNAVELPVCEAEALVLAWRLETGRRKTALEEGWLLAELAEVHGRSVSELAAEMRRAKSWVSERLGLVQRLPESVQEAVRQAKVPANAAMKSLVPMARANRSACERLVQALDGPVTVRQVERLYAAWRKADDEGKERIVAQPMLLLKAEEATAAVPMDTEERLARDFEAVAGLCRRARRQVQEGAFPRGNSLAGRTWGQARDAYLLLEEEVGRARS